MKRAFLIPSLIAAGITPLNDANADDSVRDIEILIDSPDVLIKGVRYANPGKPPVVLVHGYAGNSRNWREIGYLLFNAGFDVWMPNLRGHGRGCRHHLSVPPVLCYTSCLYRISLGIFFVGIFWNDIGYQV